MRAGRNASKRLESGTRGGLIRSRRPRTVARGACHVTPESLARSGRSRIHTRGGRPRRQAPGRPPRPPCARGTHAQAHTHAHSGTRTRTRTRTVHRHADAQTRTRAHAHTRAHARRRRSAGPHSSRRRQVQVGNFGARLGSGGAEQGHPARGRRANPTVSNARGAHPRFDDARPRRAPFLARASIRGALKPARPGRAARARSEFLGGRESAWRGRRIL